MLKNQKGFTLIEIIAVLVILGILAAVAVPRYIDMANQAKISAAQGQVAQMKSTLNLAYAKLFITNGAAPSAAASVIVSAGFTSGTAATVGTAPDVWTVVLTGTGASATIDVNGRNGDASYDAVGTWNIPS